MFFLILLIHLFDIPAVVTVKEINIGGEGRLLVKATLPATSPLLLLHVLFIGTGLPAPAFAGRAAQAGPRLVSHLDGEGAAAGQHAARGAGAAAGVLGAGGEGGWVGGWGWRRR